MIPRWAFLVGGGVLVLLIAGNVFENARVRRQTKIAVGDSVAAQHHAEIDALVAGHRADSVQLARSVDSLRRRGERIRTVTIARVDTLTQALPDTLRPILDSVVVGYETRLAMQDSLAAWLQARLTTSEHLLAQALANRDEWRTQAERWKKEATRWTLKIGPFKLGPCGFYGFTATGAQPGVGGCLSL